MQALDEVYLEADAQLGGVDQRKIMVLAREGLPKLNYESRIEIMNPMIPGLIGKKMSASDEKSKIDLLDDTETVKLKLNNADCVSGKVDNGVLAFLKHVLMIIKQDKKETFIVKRDEKYGGNLIYENYEQIEKDFIAKKVHPLDLKNALADEISVLLNSIQKNKKIFELAEKAYS